MAGGRERNLDGERIASASGAGILNVLLVTAGVIPSTHIRLLAPFDLLHRRGLVEPMLVAESDLPRVDVRALVGNADVLIVQRCTSAAACDLARLAANIGTKVVYECDDNFLAIPRNVRGDGEYYNRPDTQAFFKQMLRDSDLVTVGTERLAAEFRKFGARTSVLSNCVDFGVIGEAPRVEASDAVVIGYAGNAGHALDFDVVWPALIRLLKEYGDRLRLEFFGLVPKELSAYSNVRYVPWSDDYRGFLAALAAVDWSIGLAPLADRLHNRGKTNNKYREYGACGIPAIYSDISVYSECVETEVNGLLVPHSQQGWYKGLRRMIECPAIRSDIAKAAREDVWAHCRMEICAREWHETITDLLSRPSSSGSAI